jgi:hypothetical protein
MPSPTEPLATHIFTADPSAHSFEGKIYVYPSHDRETDIATTMATSTTWSITTSSAWTLSTDP